MIDRYCLPEMKAVWSEENKYRKWLDVEIAACEAHAELGVIPRDALAAIKKNADFDVPRILDIEDEVQHDVIAFLTCVNEYVGSAGKYIHYGMTSSDVVDTGLSLTMREAMDIIIQKAAAFSALLRKQAEKYKNTIMIGRTHGVHAEPITFGLKLLIWHNEMERNLDRLRAAREDINVGMISGAVGTYANIDPRVEQMVCKKLGLTPEAASNQVIQRDRHAEYMVALALTASSLDKFATEIRALQKTEVREVEEPFGKGQKGSSAMPHKKNPVICERVCGLARLVRTNSLAAMDNVALWHERDISHSSVERVIVPDSTLALDYMLEKFTFVIRELAVYPENMQNNLGATRGLIFSQRVLLALIAKGVLREDAYRIVQRNAMAVWSGDDDFKAFLMKDQDVTDVLKPEELEPLFDAGYYVRHVDEIFNRKVTR
ncbi:MAG: adenylosuccinate lyase [Actinomycetota bacterium]